jgi:Tfp pilus assembly protein PilX
MNLPETLLRAWRGAVDERGIALVAALATLVVLGVATTAALSYTRSNQSAAVLDQAEASALGLAESGLQEAYSTIQTANAGGANPALPTLLGCSTSSDATKSDCSQSAGMTVCVSASSGCSAGSAGSVKLYGCYTGTATPTCSFPGRTLTAATSTWVLFATGYARNPNGTTVAHTMQASVVVNPLNNGLVASVWNHLFVTADKVAGTCQLNFGGNSTTINVPLYVRGNLCLPGNTAIQEVTGGQALDLEVGGVLYMASGSHVGADSGHPITSGVVVGGCTTVSVSSTTTACDGTSPSYSYWVKTKDSYVDNAAPAETTSDIAKDYSSFDPGPTHVCSGGWDPFDIDTTMNTNATTFDLTPGTAYSCVSQSGSSVGQLTWNPTTQQLTVNGSIFFDGNGTVSRTATYTGTAVIELSGTFTMSTNNISLCATSGCDFSSWQGNSGNNSMLTIAALKASTTAISFTGNKESFQGSLWTQPTSSVSFGSNSVNIQGPISVGSISSSMNNTTIQTLPVIKNMPVGAPIPPNTNAYVGPLTYTST